MKGKNPNYVKFKDLAVGQKFKTNNAGVCVVEEIVDYKNIYIRFLDSGNKKRVQLGSLNRGEVKDLIYGVGYSTGRYSTKSDGKINKAYDLWRRMLGRCTKEWSSLHPTYTGVFVCEDWHNYDNFCDWFYEQDYQQGYELDKDLIGFGKNVYSPNTCVLIPQSLNKQIAGSRYNGFLYAPEYPDRPYLAYFRSKLIGKFSSKEECQHAYISARTSYIRSLGEDDSLPQKVRDALSQYSLGIVDGYVVRLS